MAHATRWHSAQLLRGSCGRRLNGRGGRRRGAHHNTCCGGDGDRRLGFACLTLKLRSFMFTLYSAPLITVPYVCSDCSLLVLVVPRFFGEWPCIARTSRDSEYWCERRCRKSHSAFVVRLSSPRY